MGETNPAVPPAPGAGKKEFTSSASLKRIELRRYPRFHAHEAAARLYLKGILTQIGIGRKNEATATVNLSEGGILVVTQRKLAEGAKVQIRVELEKYKDVIEVDGMVRWSFQSARDKDDFYTGIEFTKLQPGQAAHIAKMRAWFTSPEYKQKSATRRRLAPPDLKT
jgi:Tfp pilus assembly protein PilZ